MVRDQYLEKIEEIKQCVVDMGKMAKELVNDSVLSLKKQDVELAEKVIKRNEKVDKFEFEIEKKCIDLLCLQCPMAGDLRIITTCLKIITDIDRIADNAGDIADIAIKLAGKPLLKPLIDVPRMCEISTGMLDDCIEAFISGELDGLRDLSERDDIVDGLYDQVRRELLTFIIEDPRTMADASHLSFVARHLERIADHACNIGSRIHYMITGERIKYE